MTGRTTRAGGADARVGGGSRRPWASLVPLGLLVLALVLPGHMFQADQTPSTIGLGPAAWPDAMLAGLAAFSALWLIRDVWVLRRPGLRPTLTPPADDEHYHMGKALVGLALIVAYGWALPLVGFALATSAFIALWCVIGGLRRPLVVIPVTLIGTLGLLWLFMGLALMPLPRGMGQFNNFSIWLLQATGIY